MADDPRKVAVIGAGVSGLCTLKHLLSSDKKYIPTCFEKAHDIGGTWLYCDDIFTDTNGVPVTSCVYHDLLSNLPKQVMEFPDFPHQAFDHSFLTRQEVFEYLQRYTDFFKLRKYIKTHTFVTNICPVEKGRCTKWTISYFDIRKKVEGHQEIFDAVIVCNGHHGKAYIPDVKGVDEFEGEVLHSQNFKRSEHFKNKNVVILGANASGMDLADLLSGHANQIFLSHLKEPLKSTFPMNVHEKTGIKRMTRKTVIFLDDTEEYVEALIFCTGFRYDVPFFKNDVIGVKNNRLTPLYKHMVHINYPNLLFVGLPSLLLYFPQCHFQSRVAVTILNGDVTLPPEADMLKESEQDYEDRIKSGLEKMKGHYMGVKDLQWRYYEELATLTGLNPIPNYFKAIWDFVSFEKIHNFTQYRKKQYLIIGSSAYAELK